MSRLSYETRFQTDGESGMMARCRIAFLRSPRWLVSGLAALVLTAAMTVASESPNTPAAALN